MAPVCLGACEQAVPAGGRYVGSAVLLARALWLVRQGQHRQALPLLANATQTAPDDPRYAHAYAIALHSSGNTQQALATLRDALARHPGNEPLLAARRDIGAAEPR